MKNLLKAEQAAQMAMAIIALYYQPIHFSWWVWIPLFLLPDISMVGYLLNSRAGGMLYNLAHHKATAAILLGIGFFYHIPVLLFTGLLLWAHASFDRMMGYGLKYEDSFDHTHLGLIGKSAGKISQSE